LSTTKINNSTIDIDELNSRAWSLNREDAAKSIELATKAMADSVALDYVNGIACAKKTLGACHVWVAKNEEAANYCFEAISLFQVLKDKKNEAETNYILGSNFFYLSDYDTSIKYYKKSYDLSTEINFSLGLADGLNGMGTVYYTIEQNESALDVLSRSEKICREHELNSVLIKVLDGLGETYYNLKEYNKALDFYNDCLTIIEVLTGNYRVKAFALDGLGRTYTGLKQFDKALEKFNESLRIRKDIDFKFGVATTLNNIGKLFIQKNDRQNAIINLTEAFEISSKIGSKEGVFQASEKLAELYEVENRSPEALKFYKIFHQAKEDVRNHKSAQLSKSLELQNKVLQSQAEKAILEERAKELENFSESLVLMREVGQKIISSLSVATIVNTVYKSVNELMDAPGFGIGLYNAEDNTIVYPLYIEGEERFENLKYDLNDNSRLTTLCFNQTKDIVINDMEKEIFNFLTTFSAPKAGRNVESLIYLPLKNKDRLLGVITVQSFTKNAYSNYQINIFKNLATYTAIALENAKMYEEQEQKVVERTKELVKSKEEIEKTYENNKKLSEIGKEITSSLNLGNIFKKLHSSISEIMEADCFGVRIYKPESNSVEYKYEIENGLIADEISVVPLTDDNNYTVWCIKNRKDIFLNDNVNEYQKYVQQIRVVAGDMTNSLLFSPMMIGEKVVGVITVQSFNKFAYQPHHIDILRTLGTYTAIALENAYLYENMEDKVNERTQEVVKQKEEIEKTFENTRLVSEIGKEISSTFSIQEIISKVYNSINKLMDATMFGIGIFDPNKEEILFSGVIENGETLNDYSYTLQNTDRPAVWCFTTQNDYVINNFSKEFSKTIDMNNYKVIQGAATESIIYLPITQNDKKIGVITVQSYEANAYTEYHMQLLKSLAVYCAIAIDNAALYNNLETRVEERTEEIKKNYNDTRLLGDISKELSSSLSIDTIVSSVHLNINRLMRTDSFGIAIFNPKTSLLEFNGFIENDEIMPSFEVDVTDLNRLGALCFHNKKEIVINDFVSEHANYIKLEKKPIIGNDTLSIIYLPLYSKKEVIGVLTVQSLEKNSYTDYHLSLLKNLAVSIGIALDNANLYQNLEEKVNERTLEVVKQKEEIEKTYENTRLLSKIGNDITSILSLEDIVDKVYSNVNDLMDAKGFGIGVFNAEAKQIKFPLYIEDDERFSDITYEIADKDRLTNICFNSEKEIVINDFKKEIAQYIGYVQAPLQGKVVESIIYLPLFLKNKVIGVITAQSFNKNAYTDYHVQVLKNLAVYVAIAIDNASLYENMEDRVIERTAEVTKQKELLEKNFNDIKITAEITKDIASSLSVENIVSTVYEKVNNLMSAESFGIGIYNPLTESLQFPGFIEQSQKMDFFEFFLKDKERYAVWCFDNEKEIVINDVEVEYSKYLKVRLAPLAGHSPLSLIYLPLFTKEKKIGVLTVQSFSKHAYSEFHVNILKNLALSIAIALDNAGLYENLEEKVKERTTEVIKQKAIIEEKNKDITDSIKYAKKIQQAIAPNIDEFNKNFTDSFILYKPKDIVSGDFYWFEHFADTTVFAAADCTGHGVPGAFMSLICSDIMYKVVNDQKITSPADALKLIDEKLVQLIRKSSESSANDGMDIALCSYSKNDNILNYAGAHRPILIIRNGEILEYRPNKFSIGGHSTEGKHFDLNQIQVYPGDQIYLVTDGYADQFGGDKGKKFKFKNLKDLILSVSDKPMFEQKLIIDETFESWKGGLEQVDDVCLIGVKI
jgi:transcriptional regulator with GAF, ATPase, and Fis domain